eukprot:TRINITY_DN40404_c0_g1_i1.p1 TRINITY_DN40404_c0_g1~~TRINITY_DN40404_c0_g1_i1.p1  ORF type:complete len:123 (-),score=9.73 TRINITY_DN40404_c0_g1_i1:150-518(-)
MHPLNCFLGMKKIRKRFYTLWQMWIGSNSISLFRIRKLVLHLLEKVLKNKSNGFYVNLPVIKTGENKGNYGGFSFQYNMMLNGGEIVGWVGKDEGIGQTSCLKWTPDPFVGERREKSKFSFH